jgi:hypothetical protein
VGDDIYWFDSCGAQNDIETDCLACETCVIGIDGPECQAAVAHDHQGCVDDDIYWFDSCDVANDLVSDCATCEPCTDTGDGFACLAASHDHTACVGDDIYWFDSCDVQEDIHTDCLACETCVIGSLGPECQAATLHDHDGCVAEDVYWFDSCDVANDLIDDCDPCEPCTDTGDGFACLATSHDHTACAGDDIYWFDSCDVQEDIHTDCLTCETCVETMSGPVCQPADLQDHLECYSDDVWWFDSCGDPASIFDDCTTNEQCVGTTDPPECQCLPGWVGLDCDEYICDSITDTSEDCATASTIGRDDLPAALIDESTTPYSDDYDINCDGWDQPGRDRAYRMYLFAGETVNLLMDPNTDLSLFVFHPTGTSTNLCDATTEIDCSDNLNLADESITFTAVEDGWYYIVVDSWHVDAHGTYDLYINITNPVEGQCYGGGVVEPCVNQFLYFDWEEPPAEVNWPMVDNTSSVIPGMVYIYTTIENDGDANNDFDIPCDDTWYMWGLRWKPSDALATFRFQVDGNPIAPITWDISGGTDYDWDWDQANGAMIPVWSEFLTTGTHTLSIHGGASDGGNMADHPALGFVIFTNDPAFVPPDPGTL